MGESLVRGIWRLRVSESSGGCVKLKTVTEIRRSSARDRECLSCIEFFVGLEASGEMETEV